MRETSRPRGERTRRRIIEVTLDLIAEDGIRAVTQRRVAAAAEASVGLIAYYFTSTESLIAAALAELAEREARRLSALHARVLELDDDHDELVELLVDEVVESAIARKRDVIASFALTLEIPRGNIARAAFEAWEQAQFALYGAVAAAAGADDARAVTIFLLASCDGLSLYSAVSPNPEEQRRAAYAGLDRLLRSLRPEPAAQADR